MAGLEAVAFHIGERAERVQHLHVVTVLLVGLGKQ